MIRLGIIGAGGNGKGNARRLAEHKGRCRVAAVADPNKEAAEKLASDYGAKVYGDYRDFLGEVDAVVISSPNYCHKEQAVACVEAGKHIWIEKPMALSTADADAIVRAVDKAKVASFVGFSVRFEAVMQKMKEVYSSGQIGSLVSLWSRRLTCWNIKPESWRADFEKCGGLISELIAHELDWMVDMAGMPETVYCRKLSRAVNHPLDNEHLWITIGYGGGATGTIEGSQMALIADFYRGLIGTAGSVYTKNWGNELAVQKTVDSSEALALSAPFDKYGHFLDVVEGKCASLADAAWGREIVRLSEKALESAVKGQVVAVSRDK
ncbi:MAG: Gfo/Idh/MocA family protein [Bacillota bacterium]